ncbi:unnamed protein product [Spirodela intermedia]|uniref:Uncharacterized protein n=1 Tax=Spirodela intermedia TaxID=51605 RepID=A0A7I8LLU3_SPIIN|nr:unnamed protein product [Spirodela intermedia]
MKAFFLRPLLLAAVLFCLPVDASPSGGLFRHFSSIVKWTARAYPKSSPAAEESVLQFENGYVVETVVEGSSKLGVRPHSIRVSPDGELLAVDSINNNIVRITPPLSPYSRARLVAGSFQGYSGHIDGKPSDARFSRPKGVAVDDKGNLYVADTANLAIRKIGESGVTTIAGGKSSSTGYRDGPSEDAMFSSDFDVVYLGSRCSLLVVDRGNAALRQIALQQEDCDHKSTSISASDIVMVIGAMLVGYASCLLQNGFGPAFYSKQKQPSGDEFQKKMGMAGETPLVVERLEEDSIASWPSFGRLLFDLVRFSVEALGSGLLYLVPLSPTVWRSPQGLHPLKDRLIIPEDYPVEQPQPQPIQKQTTPETRQSLQKMIGKPSATLKDSLLPNKYRKRPEYGEFYGSSVSGEVPSAGSKLQKERARHRHRGGVTTTDTTKPADIKPADYADPKYDQPNYRSKFRTSDGFPF